MSIRNIIFDYGNVIANISQETIQKTFSDLGISSETLLLHHQEIKHLMHDFIDGIRPLDDVLYDIQEYCEKGTSLKKIKDTITVLQGEIPEIRLKNIVLLKKQYKIYLLSNINEIIWSNCEKRFADFGYQVDDLFDEIFLSCRMGIAKPDERIYKQMIAKTGMIPEESIFLDDRVDNCEAAQKLGIQASWVKANEVEQNADYIRLLQNA
jgi:putative hydrolase of the HAD superfamily